MNENFTIEIDFINDYKLDNKKVKKTTSKKIGFVKNTFKTIRSLKKTIKKKNMIIRRDSNRINFLDFINKQYSYMLRRNAFEVIKVASMLKDKSNVVLKNNEKTYDINISGLKISVDKDSIDCEKGYCYLCMIDGKSLCKWTCGHGCCIDCCFDNNNKSINGKPLFEKCFICK